MVQVVRYELSYFESLQFHVGNCYYSCAGDNLRDFLHFFWMYFLLFYLALCIILSLILYHHHHHHDHHDHHHHHDHHDHHHHHHHLIFPWFLDKNMATKLVTRVQWRTSPKHWGTSRNALSADVWHCDPSSYGCLGFSGIHPTSDPVLLRKAIIIY